MATLFTGFLRGEHDLVARLDAVLRRHGLPRTPADLGLTDAQFAEAVAHALTADNPKTRYLVGRDAKVRAPVAKVLPDKLMDAAISRALGQRRPG